MFELKRFGSTDLFVSPLGLGTVKFGRNESVKYPTSFELPDDKTICQLFETAQSAGMNVLDTAPSYGHSEVRIGKLLQQRKDCVLCSKVGEQFIDGQSHFDFSASAITASIETSLRRLKTDYLDIIWVHSNGDDLEIIEHDGVFESLATLKSKGYIRAYGMSSKTIGGGLASIAQADGVMVTYHPLQTQEQVVIETAAENNKGVFIKKGLVSGHLDKLATTALTITSQDPIQQCMDFIWQQPAVGSAVSCLIVGTINPAHLKHDIACCGRALTGVTNV